MLGAQQSILLKNCLESDNPVDLELAVEIFEFQSEYITQHGASCLDDIMNSMMKNAPAMQSQEMQMEMMQRVPGVLNLVISDEAFHKYGVEEEDLVKFLRQPGAIENHKLKVAMQKL